MSLNLDTFLSFTNRSSGSGELPPRPAVGSFVDLTTTERLERGGSLTGALSVANNVIFTTVFRIINVPFTGGTREMFHSINPDVTVVMDSRNARNRVGVVSTNIQGIQVQSSFSLSNGSIFGLVFWRVGNRLWGRFVNFTNSTASSFDSTNASFNGIQNLAEPTDWRYGRVALGSPFRYEVERVQLWNFDNSLSTDFTKLDAYDGGSSTLTLQSPDLMVTEFGQPLVDMQGDALDTGDNSRATGGNFTRITI